jgi:hypothetical protein
MIFFHGQNKQFDVRSKKVMARKFVMCDRD